MYKYTGMYLIWPCFLKLRRSLAQRSEQRPDLPVVRLGYTFVTHEEFVQWLQAEVKERYTGLHTYDLLTHSCNHFSNEVCNFLLGQGIPEKIFELQTLDERKLLSSC